MLRRTGHLIVGNAEGNGEGPRSMCVVDSATFRLPSAGQEWNQDIVVQCCSPTNGPQSRPGCEEAKTWSEAHNVCEGTGAGLRLCTEAEVLSGGGRGKGDDGDKAHHTPVISLGMVARLKVKASRARRSARHRITDNINFIANNDAHHSEMATASNACSWGASNMGKN